MTFHLSPAADSTASLLSVDVDSPALEEQAAVKINELNAIVRGLAEDPKIKEQILYISRLIYSNSDPQKPLVRVKPKVLSDKEMSERIERGCDLIYAAFYNRYRAHLATVESVYPGYTEHFFTAFRGHVTCLVTSSLALLERGITLRIARDAISASTHEILERLQLSYNSQKWKGAYSRRGFDHYSAQALHLALRRKAHVEKKAGDSGTTPENGSSYSFSQIYIDLNKFKDVNDLYGESVGDQVLQHVLTLILKTKRGVDILGMPGGDEYVLFLPDTDEQGAFTFAERLSTSFAYNPPVITARDGKRVVLNGREGRPSIGLSIGIYGRALNGVSSGNEHRDATVLDLLGELQKKSELAMKGAKHLEKSTIFSGRSVGVNTILSYADVAERLEEIEESLKANNMRRSKSGLPEKGDE